MKISVPVAIICLTLFVAGCGVDEQVTSLMRAAREGDTEEVKRLRSDGAEIDAQSRYGWTALMFAAWQGHEATVRVLLEAGANVNVHSDFVPPYFETTGSHPPTTALHEALRNNHTTIANLLIDCGAKIDAASVALACRESDIKLLEVLVQKGADLNAPTENAFYASPLCAAARAGNLAMVKWLVDHGADPNLVAVAQTPLKEAVERDHLEMVRYLLENGANPNTVYDTTQQTALFTAATKTTDPARHDDNLAIIKLLIAHGADTEHMAFNNLHTALDFVRTQNTNDASYPIDSIAPEARAGHRESLEHKDAVIALLEGESK